MTCDSCGKRRLYHGEVRWHGRRAKWHCVTCLPAAGGERHPPRRLTDEWWLCVLLCLAILALGVYLNGK